jgi:exopolysaccharide biosynthesis protein
MNHFAQYARSVSILFFLCVSVVNLHGQELTTVHTGIEYAQVEHKIGEDPVKINLLKLDLAKVRLDVKLGMDMVIGTETTSSIAMRHGAVAAINSGFFRLDNSIFAGEPAGILKIDNVLLSESLNDRVAMMIENGSTETRVHFHRAEAGNAIIVSGRQFNVGTNRERLGDDIVIYTREFNRTSLTGPGGMEFVVQNGRVRRIFIGQGSNVIPENGYLISASGTRRDELRPLLRVGTRVGFLTLHSSPENVIPEAAFGRAEDITNGVSHLIRNGSIDLTWEAEKASRGFAENRHPRTAVAKMREGKFLMITVDGRQPGVSVGMTLQELADYLLSLGAIDAINLDGGGSTTMFLYGKVVNTPSDANGERKVGDAIIVTLRSPGR